MFIHEKRKIRVVNPIPGSDPFISRRRADALLTAGLAYMCGTSIRIIHRGERMPSKPGDMTAMGYDERGALRLDEIREVPVLMPEKLLNERTRVRVGRTKAYRNGPVRRVAIA